MKSAEPTAPDAAADATTAARLEAAFTLLPSIFRRCTDPESARYALGAPATIGDHVYCTDGRIVVRMLATPEIREAVLAAKPEGRFPKVDEVFATLPPAEQETFPAAIPDDAPKCPECRGAGTIAAVVCSSCHGEGDYDCPHCEQHTTCRACSGKGVHPWPGASMTCPACAGCGVEDGAHGGVLVHGRAKVGYRYLAIVRAAGGSLQFAAEEPHDRPIRFATPDGVEGVMMPMYRD
jgi:hypothetical protein